MASALKKWLTVKLVSSHTWLNREQRRKKTKISVKNKSLATCHPKDFNILYKLADEKAAKGLKKTMCKAYKSLQDNTWTKWLWILRRLFPKIFANG